MHQLAACLKGKDVECDIFIEELEKDFYSHIKAYRPDFILYSLYIGEEDFMLKSFSKLKNIMPDIKTVVGGPFTLVFQEIVKNKQIDFLIRGDGEQSLPLFLELYQDGGCFKDVPGICFIDENSALFMNEDVQLTQDLTTLPRPDRDLYYKYESLRRKETKMFIASRGCPYRCTYCYNAELAKAFPTPYWRLRNVHNVIEEIRYVKDRYPLKWVHFQDGTFNSNKKWLKNFLKEYSKYDLPGFMCNARVENIDEDIVRLLKKAGCNRITFGIQSGNPKIRQEIAGRAMSNKQIIEACELCKKYAIRVSIDIIFAWPGETLKEAMDTIRLCRTINVETYSSNVLIFYPGLRITHYASENGYIKANPTLKDIAHTNPNKSLLIDKKKKLLINMDKYFYYLIRFPILEKAILLLLKLPPNRLFYLLKNVHFLWRSFKYDHSTSKFRIVRNYITNGWKAVSS